MLEDKIPLREKHTSGQAVGPIFNRKVATYQQRDHHDKDNVLEIPAYI